MADDDVQLTDLEVIQRYSLAVRGASASRAELVAALQADLAWLQSGRRAAARTAAPAKVPGKAAPAGEPAAKASPRAAVRTATKDAPTAPAKKSPAKAAAGTRRT